jgi:hypothetical protein
MTRTTRQGIVIVGLAGVIGLVNSTQPAAAQTLKVKVRVENQANIPNDLLADAESTVTGIYADAGIETTFVNGEADFMIKLLSRYTEGIIRRGPDTVGFAPSTDSDRGHVAYVFQTRVDRIAEGYSAPRPIVLGAAIAHEMGHLLLPDNAHSKTGIMQGTWNQVDFRRAVHGQLVFTPEQVAQIRCRLINAQRQITSQ